MKQAYNEDIRPMLHLQTRTRELQIVWQGSLQYSCGATFMLVFQLRVKFSLRLQRDLLPTRYRTSGDIPRFSNFSTTRQRPYEVSCMARPIHTQ